MRRRFHKTLLITSFLVLIGIWLKPDKDTEILYIGAIPDQNPEKLNRLYNLVSEELSNNLEVNTKYIPVTNYAAAVSAFRNGSLDLVWFGGLTGVQARIQKPGSFALAQREIDSRFTSVFIASRKSKIPVLRKLEDLNVLKNKRFTFGSESSTSGRLMPQYFLKKAGVSLSDFSGGRPGFSGSHDATIVLVQSGSYQAGVLNEQVWNDNIDNGRVNQDKVTVIWRTPTYADYHWLIQPNLDKRFGSGFTNRVRNQLLTFNKENESQKMILDLFGAKKFIPTSNEQYLSIEKIGREIGKIK